MNKKQLAQLRKEIVLNSFFISDYNNSFGIDPNIVCAFFDGYMDYLCELEEETGKDAFALDNKTNLWAWYLCHDQDPLPIPYNADEAEAKTQEGVVYA